mmetsp:Transcript_23519/g.76511  ORF Transcript_23519/g.76511 Transcript_23519/m.76511 type:complete len:320 (-) Transcript_23519:1142-2101(-)
MVSLPLADSAASLPVAADESKGASSWLSQETTVGGSKPRECCAFWAVDLFAAGKSSAFETPRISDAAADDSRGSRGPEEPSSSGCFLDEQSACLPRVLRPRHRLAWALMQRIGEAPCSSAALMQAWMPKKGANGARTLVTSGAPWAVSDPDFKAFRQANLSFSLGAGQCVPGRVYASGHMELGQDIKGYADERSFTRKKLCVSHGLRSVLCVPVHTVQARSDPNPLFVIELFFSTGGRAGVQELIQALPGILASLQLSLCPAPDADACSELTEGMSEDAIVLEELSQGIQALPPCGPVDVAKTPPPRRLPSSLKLGSPP